MLVGLLTGLLIAGINIPLANFLARATRSPWAFLIVYLILGLIIVIAGYFLISLLIVPSLQVYGLVALLAYASIGGERFKEKKAIHATKSGLER